MSWKRLTILYFVSHDVSLLTYITFHIGKNLTGTARYASISTHLGIGKFDIFVLSVFVLYFTIYLSLVSLKS